jgi:hypothetical protein
VRTACRRLRIGCDIVAGERPSPREVSCAIRARTKCNLASFGKTGRHEIWPSTRTFMFWSW